MLQRTRRHAGGLGDLEQGRAAQAARAHHVEGGHQQLLTGGGAALGVAAARGTGGTGPGICILHYMRIVNAAGTVRQRRAARGPFPVRRSTPERGFVHRRAARVAPRCVERRVADDRRSATPRRLTP